MLVGYARVSTQDQTLRLQMEALGRAGCERIFLDKAGAHGGRESLADALADLRRGDELVVYTLDRLGRTARQLIKLVDELRKREIGIRILIEQTDGAKASGSPFMQAMAALSEMECSLMRERTHLALAVAKARAREVGRRRKLSAIQIEQVKSLLASRANNVSEIAASFGVARSTLYRAIERESAGRTE